MAGIPDILVRIGADATGVDDALNRTRRELDGFGGSVAKIGAGILAAFSVEQAIGGVVNFLKDAAAAAIEDEKSLVALRTAMQNVGQGFANSGVEKFIKGLSLATGIADDQLRPAFQRLVTATGNVERSQSLLQTALDLSAAGYGDVTSAADALGMAASGQMTRLNRLTKGALGPAIVKSKDFAAALEVINRKFGGQAAAAADTYGGKLDRVRLAADEAKETIGYALLDAIDSVSEAFGGVGGAQDAIGKAGDKLAAFVTLAGKLVTELTRLKEAGGGDDSIWSRIADGIEGAVKNTPGLKQVADALDIVGKATEAQRLETEAQAKAQEMADRINGAAASRYTELAAAIDPTRAAMLGLTDATTDSTAAAEDDAAAKAEAAAETKRLKDETDALRRSLDLLYGNADSVTTAIRAAGKAAREAKGDLTSNKDAAIDLRAAFGDGAQAILNFAQANGTSAKDTLRIWDEQVARLRTNLIKNGVKASDVDAFINKNLWQTRFMLLADVIGKGPAAEAMRLSGLALGRNAWQGIVDALNSTEARNAVYGAASTLGGRVNAGAAAALDENSPSRTMYRIGAYATEGLALGITSGGEAVSKAVVTVAGKVAAGAREVIDGQVSQWKGVLDSSISAITSMAGGIRDQVMGQLDFSLTDAEGKPLTPDQIVQSLFGGLTQMGEVAKQVSTSIGDKLPPELLSKILAMPPDTAIALARYFSENPALLTQLQTGYQALADYTYTNLGLPMGEAWAMNGEESAAKMLQSAKDFLAKHADGFARWVRQNLSVTLDVGVRYVSTGDLPGRATGGPVSAGNAFVVGERGPEIFVPSVSGTIVPNGALGSGGASGGGSNVNVTVNAGMGANGYEIGRQVVEAIRKYERVSGPVFARAS